MRADREGKHLRRRNIKTGDFTHPFSHKSTLLGVQEAISSRIHVINLRLNIFYMIEILQLINS